MTERARVSLSVHEGKLEVEGSEAFVEKQLERLEDVMHALLLAPRKKQSSERNLHADLHAENNQEQHEKPGSLNAYPNVLALADERVQILVDLPGSNKAEKTVSAALLHLLASDLRGIKTVPFADIRETCSAHACLDQANFAATMKDQKTYFLCGGSGKKQTASLTVPGRKRAEELARELNAS